MYYNQNYYSFVPIDGDAHIRQEIRPSLLKKGDTIGLITPGSPRPIEDTKKRVQFLEDMGYNVLPGDYFWSHDFPASSPEERASDIMKMFTNPQVKMILPLTGGTGVADVLEYLDYYAIAANPKIITGYSDLSILLNTITQITGLITFNGLMLRDIGPETPDFNFESFFEAISTLDAPRLLLNPQGMPLLSMVDGIVEGPIVGGNISSILGSLGTPFEINTAGKIFFLEEVGEGSPNMYRFLTHLMRAGKFKDCIGIIMGECTNCSAAYGMEYLDIVEKVLKPLGKPLLVNLATSHGQFKVTVPIGSRINLNTQKPTITLLEPSVSEPIGQSLCC